jgi:hypothetical protein
MPTQAAPVNNDVWSYVVPFLRKDANAAELAVLLMYAACYMQDNELTPERVKSAALYLRFGEKGD